MPATPAQRNLIIIAGALLLLCVLAVVAVMVGRSRETGAIPARANATSLKPGAAPAASAAPRLKVGVYLSAMTGDKWGVSCQVTGDLLRGHFRLIPLIEAGSENAKGIGTNLHTFFLGEEPMNVADAAALKKLDVIVAPRIWLIPDDARAAIEEAVTGGVGLLARDGIGCMDPGSGDDISRLNGFDESAFGYNPYSMECEVLASHPILGKLKPGDIVKVTPNGTWGVPGAKTVPLVKVKDMDKFHEFFRGTGEDWTFYPIYVGELGKGRIVGTQFEAWKVTPKDLQKATDDEFNIRAIQWLAHRLEEPATKPAATPSSAAAP